MITMWDNISAASIPANAQACAGYAGGRWPDFKAMVQRFPKLAAEGRVKSIAVNDQETAHILDVEQGDATPAQAPGWVKRMLAEPPAVGIYKPGIYASLSAMGAVKRALANAGIQRSAVLLWVADWTYIAHLPPGYDACQWTDKAGPNDESLCLDSFFPPLPAPVPPPQPPAPPLRFAAEVEFEPVHKTWSIAPLPFNAPPLK